MAPVFCKKNACPEPFELQGHEVTSGERIPITRGESWEGYRRLRPSLARVLAVLWPETANTAPCAGCPRPRGSDIRCVALPMRVSYHKHEVRKCRFAAEPGSMNDQRAVRRRKTLQPRRRDGRSRHDSSSGERGAYSDGRTSNQGRSGDEQKQHASAAIHPEPFLLSPQEATPAPVARSLFRQARPNQGGPSSSARSGRSRSGRTFLTLSTWRAPALVTGARRCSRRGLSLYPPRSLRGCAWSG